jgi:hypothetical protein
MVSPATTATTQEMFNKIRQYNEMQQQIPIHSQPTFEANKIQD